MLSDLGYDGAAEAGDIDQAISFAQSAKFDPAILDVNVNGKTSRSVAGAAALRNPLFVFATGYGRRRTAGKLSTTIRRCRNRSRSKPPAAVAIEDRAGTARRSDVSARSSRTGQFSRKIIFQDHIQDYYPMTGAAEIAACAEARRAGLASANTHIEALPTAPPSVADAHAIQDRVAARRGNPRGLQGGVAADGEPRRGLIYPRLIRPSPARAAPAEARSAWKRRNAQWPAS